MDIYRAASGRVLCELCGHYRRTATRSCTAHLADKGYYEITFAIFLRRSDSAHSCHCVIHPPLLMKNSSRPPQQRLRQPLPQSDALESLSGITAALSRSTTERCCGPRMVNCARSNARIRAGCLEYSAMPPCRQRYARSPMPNKRPRQKPGCVFLGRHGPASPEA